ncbi:MAG: MATE family efflux transporter [Clostridiales bacterium]|nr:MATE family efflux transporter [Clostridiales bacterium]
MKDNTQVFENYKVPKAVATMAIPSMLGMLINIVYNLADTFFVGQTGDSNQVAAVSVAMPVFLMLMAFGNLFGVGGCAFISRSLGEGRRDRVKQISSFCVYSAIIAGVIMGAIFVAFKKPILYLVGASDNTIGFAQDYLLWVGIGAPFVVTAIMAGNLVRGEGAAKTSMLGMALGQIVNIVLDPIFILGNGDSLFGFSMPFGFDMGVSGAAIATVIGNICSVVFFLIYFMRGKSILSITPKRFTLKDGIPMGVIGVGLPASLNNFLMSLSNIIVNMVLVNYGDNAVAAMGVALKANMIVVMLQIGLSQGVQPLIGYCYGAKNFKRMKKCMRFSIGSNVVIGTVMTVFLIVFRENIISMFIDNSEVVDLGVRMITALMATGPVIGIMFIFNFSFQGMGKAAQSLVLSIGRQGLVYIPLLLILNSTLGLDGVIMAQPISDCVVIILSLLMWMTVRKDIKKQQMAINQS